MNLRAGLALGLLVFGANASAQEVVNSPDYHARHNAGSVYYQGPGQQPAQQQQPPQPTGYWEKTWGAIAPSPVGGVLGTALGASSKEEAERLALEDCKAKGGGVRGRVGISQPVRRDGHRKGQLSICERSLNS